jgi:hypothetical protein
VTYHGIWLEVRQGLGPEFGLETLGFGFGFGLEDTFDFRLNDQAKCYITKDYGELFAEKPTKCSLESHNAIEKLPRTI